VTVCSWNPPSPLAIALALGLALGAPSGAVAEDSTSPAVVMTTTVFERTLVEKLGRPVDFQAVHLDLTNESDAGFQQTLATLLARKYAGHPIDVVLAQRAEALSFLLRYRPTLLTGVPIVFTDVFAGELGEIRLPPDVTGAVTAGVSRTVPIALDLLPDTRRFVVVGGGAVADRRAAEGLQRN
jgi:hypothetical protein